MSLSSDLTNLCSHSEAGTGFRLGSGRALRLRFEVPMIGKKPPRVSLHAPYWLVPSGKSSNLCTAGASALIAGALLVGLHSWDIRGQEPVWQEVLQAGSFICHAEFPFSQTSAVRDQLLRLEHDLAHALGIEPRPILVEVFLLADQSRYRAFLAHYFPDVPYRRALYIRRDGRTMVMTFRSPQLEVDLRHECVHALLHGWLPYLPLWLDEGLAKYFEQPPGRRAFEHPYLRTVRFQAWLGYRLALEELESLHDMTQMGAREYRASWAWVHYLLHGPAEVNEELRAYLQEIQRLNMPGPLSVRLRKQVPDLEKSFLAHFRSWKP